MTSVFIGLPVFNGEAFLSDALESLLSQTYQDFTVLISDNASTDSTRDICADFSLRDSRILYHRHERNLGAAPNFNFCVERAKGKYFKWMAHDDVCLPTYLERCVARLDTDPGVVLTHARTRRIDDVGQPGELYERELNFDCDDPAIRFARTMALDHACVSVFGVMRLDVLERTPGIAPFVGSDRSLLAELALYGRLETIPEELFHWRDHSTRSVRLDRRQRIAWFYAKAKPTWASLFVRQLLANQSAVLRAPVAGSTRVRALASTVRWMLRNRMNLWGDARRLAGAAIRGRGGAAGRQG